MFTCNMFNNNNTEEVHGSKAAMGLGKRDGKLVTTIMHCWVYNTNSYNMYKNATKWGKLIVFKLQIHFYSL